MAQGPLLATNSVFSFCSEERGLCLNAINCHIASGIFFHGKAWSIKESVHGVDAGIDSGSHHGPGTSRLLNSMALD